MLQLEHYLMKIVSLQRAIYSAPIAILIALGGVAMRLMRRSKGGAPGALASNIKIWSCTYQLLVRFFTAARGAIIFSMRITLQCRHFHIKVVSLLRGSV